ncbi:hypothetical protein [Caulobacter sp. UNC279MFTsu5.1]|uniref:hypothetical protein n=1 Tax=Caulobacter sp. UNC279MFTsu5.1 TaxID=1502775 RepID=UPI0003670DFC|nr:hypothetical protein [Caulobacter sp. UNC279MFTsu5.1]SFK71871.1 hypothetical protein SAMN02799626_04995 [Caulobacter sp. UNC279MFTsu5.1]
MASKTDPAIEFAELCTKLAASRTKTGTDHLADHFKVDAWSYEFYQILFCIIERANQIKMLVAGLPDAAHIAPDLTAHIDDLLNGFQPQSMMNRWDQHGATYVNAKNIQPIKMVSVLLRQHVSYPVLSEEEREDVLSQVADLTKWLEEIQVGEHDFIRQAIIDGLRQFSFRLSRIEWLGWGYSVASLKDVIGAYLALERGTPTDGSNPQAEAVLKRLGAALKSIYRSAGVTKDVVERGDFLLKAYGAASLFVHSHHGIAGLLTFG